MPFTGEWWNQSQRPILKTGRGVTADVEEADLATCAVTCAKIAAGAVVSEKASSALRYSSIQILADPRMAVSSSEGPMASTTFVIWRPLVNINVLRVQHVVASGQHALAGALGTHQNATCDNFTLYGNAGTSISDIALKAVSTAVAPGTRTAGSAINLAALAACTNVLAKYFGSTCSQPTPALLQIDYETSG